MPGDDELGAVLRELRTVRRLTLAAVARHAGCTPSLLSYVESGHRQLQPWLAEELDRIYETGGVVSSLVRKFGSRFNKKPGSRVSNSGVFVVSLPNGGASMPLSRRELVTALGVGIVGGTSLGQFERLLDGIKPDSGLLRYFEDAFNGFQEAARILAPRHLMDGLLGNVAILDGLRRRAADSDRSQYSALQARYAESLSWLSEEAGDLPGAMYWVDRASQWAHAANWPAMTKYNFIRRSMMVISFSDDGHRAIDQARHVLDMPDSSPRMKGLAAKQIAFGYALAQDRNASRHVLDAAMDWLAQP